MKFKDFLILFPLGLALTSCGNSSPATSTDANSATIQSAAVVSNSTGSSGSSIVTPVTTPTGSSGSLVNAQGCAEYPQHPIYNYSNLQGTGSGPTQTTPNEIVADTKLRVSLTPGSANVTVGTGATANYTYMSADVHLLRNGAEVATITVSGNGYQAPNGYTYPMGVQVGTTSNPASADFSNYLTGNSTYSLYVTNVKTDYKCNQMATFAYYADMGDCEYYYNAGYAQYATCSGVWNWDYHQSTWACCYTNMLEQAQELQCGVGVPLSNASYSVTAQVETDSTPCIGAN